MKPIGTIFNKTYANNLTITDATISLESSSEDKEKISEILDSQIEFVAVPYSSDHTNNPVKFRINIRQEKYMC